MFSALRQISKKGSFISAPLNSKFGIYCNVGRSFSVAAADGAKIYKKVHHNTSTKANNNIKSKSAGSSKSGGRKPSDGPKPYKYVASDAGANTATDDSFKSKLWKKVDRSEESDGMGKLGKPHASSRDKSEKFGGKSSKRGSNYTRLFKADKMSEFIANAYEKRQSELLMEAYSYAEKNNIKLSLEEYSAVLWACSQIATPDETDADSNVRRASTYRYISNGGRALEAIEIYKHLKSVETSLPTPVFLHVMKVCAQFGSATTAAMLLNDFKVMKHDIIPELLADYVITVAKFTRRNGANATNHLGSLGQHGPSSSSGSFDRSIERDLFAAYLEYIDLVHPPLPAHDEEGNLSERDSIVQYQEEENVSREKLESGGVMGTEEVYTQMARTFSFLGREDAVIDILKHYVEAGFEPGFEFCTEIFENALLEGDPKTLVVLSNWFLANFEDVILPEGCIQKMLQIGCGGGNSILAGNSIELLRKCGYPVTGVHYAGWVAGSTSAHDLPSILEALMEAEHSGIDLYSTEGVDGFLLQDKLSVILSSSLRNMDELYYALVDIIRQDEAAPALAVNAIIAAAGMNSQLDRAFATMQECSTLFNLTPTVDTYNALLCAVARSPDNCFMKTMLSLFERMEDEDLQPNAISYSFLIDAMIELAHYQHLDDILAHITVRSDTHGSVLPPQKALRRLVIGLATHPKYCTKIDQVLPLLHRNAEGNLPAFLQRRLDTVTRQREQAELSEQEGE